MKGCSSLGAKTARACDSCLRVRARWFCAADDAFLCHGCDNLVHSANQLASRHERIRLQASSPSSSSSKMMMIRTIAATEAEAEGQAWCSGFTRKARTPRHNNKNCLVQQEQEEEEGGGKGDEEEGVFTNYHSSMFLPVVPELGSEDQMLLDDYETEDQMLCRVPVFDPFDDDSELCSVYNEVKKKKKKKKQKKKNNNDADDLEGAELLPTDDVDLAEFAADVENLLDIDDGLEIKEERERDNDDNKGATTMIKVKDELLQLTNNNDDDCNLESILDWNIDSSKSMMMGVVEHEEEEEEENNKVPVMVASGGNNNNNCSSKVEIIKKEKLLRLNYEEVISAWASQGSPWTTPNPPNFNFVVDDCWPHYLGSSSGGSDVELRNIMRWNEVGGVVDDGGREARVSRYREKRRTRLFAKKIRYEVRKLNAEKRPRMKGRFVKRTSSSPSSFVGGAISSAASFPPHQFSLTSN